MKIQFLTEEELDGEIEMHGAESPSIIRLTRGHSVKFYVFDYYDSKRDIQVYISVEPYDVRMT